MHLVLLTHPPSFQTASQPRFTEMIRQGMEARGHAVELWTNAPRLAQRSVPSAFFRKWLGYVDQFLIYPRELRRRVDQQPRDTVFVVTDQALGMWVPHLAHRPHVIHCHDFLALRSALGEFPEHLTGWPGRQYQRLIRNGFSRGRAFIPVSEKSQSDLHRFLPQVPRLSEVAYNGLNHPFRPMELAERLPLMKKTGVAISEQGFILHVGGNQWYKNRKGVLAIYRAYAAQVKQPAALWLIGSAPTDELRALADTVPAPGKIHFFTGLGNEQVNAAYAHAKALLFPSLEEGFGWPIAEAMAAGCPVITTDAAPMTEVAGNAARLIPRMPANPAEREHWAKGAAKIVAEVMSLNADERARMVRQGQSNAARFDTKMALDTYEKIYQRTLRGDL